MNAEHSTPNDAKHIVVACGDGFFSSFSANDVQKLRREHRLVGELVGTAPFHSSQNQFLSLPNAWSTLEVALGITEGFFVLAMQAEDVFERVTDDDVGVSLRERVEAEREQVEEERRRAEARHLQSMAEQELRLAKRRANAPPRSSLPTKRQRLTGAISDGGESPARSSRLWSFVWRPMGLISAAVQWLVKQSKFKMQAVEKRLEKDEARHLREPRPYHVRLHVGRAPYERVRAHCRYIDSAKELVKLRGWKQVLASTAFAVFRDLWRRGFYLTNGNKFGADFLAYANDPCLFHAGLCVVVVDENTNLHPREMISLGRLGVATKKRSTLAYLDNASARVQYLGIAWCESLP